MEIADSVLLLSPAQFSSVNRDGVPSWNRFFFKDARLLVVAGFQT
jgi:hypothetical protein